jgi:uncharacterized protein (DUF58 family)
MLFREEQYEPGIVQSLGRIDLISKVLAKGMQLGTVKSSRHGFSTEFSEYANYQQSDDLRLIDWRLYARTDKLYVKKYEAETDIEVRMLLDGSRSMSWAYKDEVTKLEYSVNLLAALATLHISRQNKVGLFLQGENELSFLPPRSQRKQLDAIFVALASVVPGGENCLEKLCQEFGVQQRQRGMTVLFSDFEEDFSSVLTSLDQLSAVGNDVIVFHILHAAEVNFPYDKVTHVKDSETGRMIKLPGKGFREKYEQGIVTFRQKVKDACSQRNIAYVGLDTSMNYLTVMKDFLEEMRKFFEG